MRNTTVSALSAAILMALAAAPLHAEPGEPVGPAEVMQGERDSDTLHPAVALRADGQLALTFSTPGWDQYADAEIWARLGMPQSMPATPRLLALTTGPARQSAIALPPDSEPLMLWTDTRYHGVWLAREFLEGPFDPWSAISNKQLISETGAQDYAFPALALAPRAQQALATWLSLEDEGYVVRGRYLGYSSDGVWPSSPELRLPVPASTTASRPAVALDVYGHGHAAWIEPSSDEVPMRRLRVQNFDNPGAGPVEVYAEYSPDERIVDVAIAADPQGMLLVVWVVELDRGGQTEAMLLGRYVHPYAGYAEAIFPIGGDLAPVQAMRAPSVAIDAVGRFTVSWEQKAAELMPDPLPQPEPFLSMIRRFDERREPLEAPRQVQADDALWVADTQLAIDADGDASVVWTEQRADGRTEAKVRRFRGNADVDLELGAGLPELADPEATTSLFFDVHNLTPSEYWLDPAINVATGLSVDVTLPEGTTLEYIYDYDWACAGDLNVRCTSRSPLPTQNSRPLHMLVRFPAGVAQVDVSARASGDQHDSNQDNNVLARTIELADLMPDAFSFARINDAPLGSVQISDPVTVTGFDRPLQIWAWNGEYSIDGGPFQMHNSEISPGQTVRMRQTVASTPSTTRWSYLYIGNASGSFSTVTEPADTSPNQLIFEPRVNVPRGSEQDSGEYVISGINAPAPISIVGGSYSIDGGAYRTTASTISNGQRLHVRHTAAADFSTRTETTLTVGDMNAVFASTTEARDLMPDAIAFATQEGVARGVTVISEDVVVNGINAPAPISVSGGLYRVDEGAWTAMPGTINAGQRVRLHHTSATTFSTRKEVVLSIGDMNVAMASVTEAQDVVPDAFAFAEQRDVDRSTVVISEEITVAGINDAAPISVSGGSYAIDGYNFVTTPGTVRAGQKVRVRHSSAADFATTVSTQLSIGGVIGQFASTTEARDSTPSQFLFSDQTGVATGVEVTSAALGIVDINVPTPISVEGGSYSINGGPFTTAPGTVVWLDQIRVRHTAAADANSTVDTVLTVGGVSDTFSSTTGAIDTTPAVYTFVDVSGVKRNRYIYSTPVSVSGINAAVPISVSGGYARYSINGGSYTSATGTVRAGDQVRLELRSSSASYSTVSATVTIGGVSDSWSVRTGR